MSLETSRGQQVLDWLKAEKQGYEALLALLDQEWECLKHRDITGLIPLTRAKENQILALHGLEQTIKQGLPSEKGRRKPVDGGHGGSRAELRPLGGLHGQNSKIHPEIKNGNPGPE